MIVRNLKVEPNWHCEVIGYLYYDDDRSELGETMAEIVTPEEVLIDCGWFPEGDPDGQYCVTVSQGLEKLMPDYETPDIEAAAVRMEKVAKMLCTGTPIPSAASATQEVTVANFAFPSAYSDVIIEDHPCGLIASCI